MVIFDKKETSNPSIYFFESKASFLLKRLFLIENTRFFVQKFRFSKRKGSFLNKNLQVFPTLTSIDLLRPGILFK